MSTIVGLCNQIAGHVEELETALADSGYPAASMTNSGASRKAPGPRSPCSTIDLDYLDTEVDPELNGWCAILADHLHEPLGRAIRGTRTDRAKYIAALAADYTAAGGNYQQLHTDLADLAQRLAARLNLLHGEHSPARLPPVADAAAIAAAKGVAESTVRTWHRRGKITRAYLAGGRAYYHTAGL